MRLKAFAILILSYAFLFISPAKATDEASSINVVFLSPDTSRFWQSVGGFMEAVAEDLEMDLTIHTDQSKNRYSYRELLETVLSRPDRPDYIILMCKEKVTHEMLTMIGEAGVKAFTFNTAVPDEAIRLTGQPREKLDHWIGHVSPDNFTAGYTLTTELYQRHWQRHGSAPLALIGLSGTRDSSAAIDRNQGLNTALSEYSPLVNQVVFANWDSQEAAEKVERLIERYPQLDLIWSASDGMAMGAIAALESKGLVPGSDALVGGIDWESRALDEIAEGRLELSLGRHFMGGGLALLLIRDYHSGYDFADQGKVSMNYRFAVADQSNLAAVRQVMNPLNWELADFRPFSRYYNERIRSEPVTASGLLDQFMGALSPGFR